MPYLRQFGYFSLFLFSLFVYGCSGGPSGGDPSASGANVSNPSAIDSYYTISPVSGVVSLTVNFEAIVIDGIVSYEWDFGDGNAAMGPSQTHIYNTPGTYTTQLTVTDSQNNTYTAERNVYVFASIDNSNVIVPNGVTFFDDFNYAAGRDNPNVVSIFQNAGWNWVKTMQAGETGSHGYVYTTDRIPGYNGTFPGTNSNRVLAIEALPWSLGVPGQWNQTDFYLEYGCYDAVCSNENIPGNVWFQFWIYPNYYDDPNDLEDQLSGSGRRMKFLYPCRGFYPCQDQHWLYMLGGTSNLPFFDELGIPTPDDPARDLYMMLHGNSSELSVAGAPEGAVNAYKLGQNDISERLVANRWTLVKLHMDTSTSSGRYEAWIKPIGGDWVKVSEWIDGQNGVTWNVADPSGHKIMRMPTTVGDFDSWYYMDDFAMATSENDLPVYP